MISVGNPTVGGTGKTPVTLAVARLLSEDLGLATTILSRGYGAVHRRPVTPVGEGGRALAPPEEIGDEARLLLEGAPRARVVVSRRRALGARFAVDEQGAAAVVLDDGMQYWRLRRDLDIACVDARELFGNGRIFPAGPLRESPSSLARAGAVVVKSAGTLRPGLEARLRALAPDAALYRARTVPTGWREVATGARREPGELRGQLVTAACGLAHPEGFFELAEELAGGALVRRAFPDHHRFRDADLAGLPRPAAITAKDAADLEPGAVPAGVWVLEVEVEVEPLAGSPALGELLRELTRSRAPRSPGPGRPAPPGRS